METRSLDRPLTPMEALKVAPEFNSARLTWDVQRRQGQKYATYWRNDSFRLLPPELFVGKKEIWLEVGAGTGHFAVEMARRHPETFVIAIERDKARGITLAKKTTKSGLENFLGLRGNVIPAVVDCTPDASLDRIYILYPCPWPKNTQRKHRWYLHPMMAHLVRALKPGGRLIWASDQKFYIDEARYVCEKFYPLNVEVHGEIAPNAFNDLETFPGGRTKFERTFLASGQPCYELIVTKR